jgi:transmembrane 9 superfamily protein 1
MFARVTVMYCRAVAHEFAPAFVLSQIDVEFSYSAHWMPTTVQYVDRMSLHSKSAIGEQAIEIHWLSIINSFVLVILLTAFLAMILMRALHKDFARYMELDEEDMDAEEQQDESGFKLVHGDVFRVPSNIMLLSSAVGNGLQILVLILSILLLALIGTFYPGNRGALYSACLFFYAATTCISGYTATNLYMQLGGTRWAMNSIVTASLFAVPFFTTFSVANSVAWYHGSSSALPAGTIVLIILLWVLISFPLTVFGR